VKRVEGTRARIYDTRKTTPLLRSLEKNAVLAGGGENHRFGLYDQILVKENHIFAFCQEKGLPTRGPAAVASVVRAARAARPEGVRLEIEVRDGDEAEAAARAGAEIVLLDNFTVEDLAATVKTIRALEGPAATTLLEASGGITLETVAAVARTGVDRISVGALTHSASALDLSLLMGDE
jgi:nicotinate-nucleotide pyrophosphorylase (carboxylating)